jgi:mRNA-degrading endonuclease RelE of RelBE toxin-antitoxin system
VDAPMDSRLRGNDETHRVDQFRGAGRRVPMALAIVSTGIPYNDSMLLTVIEHPAFQRQAANIWSDKEREDFIDFMAANPQAGDVIKETSPAARKVRWKRQGMGKRGGVRVIYYYLDEDDAVLLLTLYTKSDEDALSAAEINQLAKGI